MNFLCISFTFCFCFLFFGGICGRHFLKHNNAKTNSFQPLRVKISIFIWTMWKNSLICIDFVHKITFWSRNFRTVPPGVTNLVSKCAGNLKEKSHKVSQRELCALQSNHTKCRGGPLRPPPPSLFRVKPSVPCIGESHPMHVKEPTSLLAKELGEIPVKWSASQTWCRPLMVHPRRLYTTVCNLRTTSTRHLNMP